MYGTLYLRQYSVTLYFTLYSVINTVLQALYVELYSVINTVLFTLLGTPYSIVYTLSSLHCTSYSVLCIRYTISLLDTELLVLCTLKCTFHFILFSVLFCTIFLRIILRNNFFKPEICSILTPDHVSNIKPDFVY